MPENENETQDVQDVAVEAGASPATDEPIVPIAPSSASSNEDEPSSDSETATLVTEFFDGNAIEFDCYANDPTRETVTKWKVITRNKRSVWLRTQPAEKHNSVTFLLTEKGYCNDATSSYRKDIAAMKEIFDFASNATARHYDKVKDKLNEAADASASAELLKLDLNSLASFMD